MLDNSVDTMCLHKIIFVEFNFVLGKEFYFEKQNNLTRIFQNI